MVREMTLELEQMITTWAEDYAGYDNDYIQENWDEIVDSYFETHYPRSTFR